MQTLDQIRSARDTIKDYYFVINVESGAYNLNSSWYRIGQYNRNSYKRVVILHQLKKISDTYQLIFIGPFQTFVWVKGYERRILPLLEEIMKIPVVKYNTFVIDKDSFALIWNPEDPRHYQALSVDMNKE